MKIIHRGGSPKGICIFKVYHSTTHLGLTAGSILPHQKRETCGRPRLVTPLLLRFGRNPDYDRKLDHLLGHVQEKKLTLVGGPQNSFWHPFNAYMRWSSWLWVWDHGGVDLQVSIDMVYGLKYEEDLLDWVKNVHVISPDWYDTTICWKSFMSPLVCFPVRVF